MIDTGMFRPSKSTVWCLRMVLGVLGCVLTHDDGTIPDNYLKLHEQNCNSKLEKKIEYSKIDIGKVYPHTDDVSKTS